MPIIESTSGLMDNFMGKSMYPIYKVINDASADYEKENAVLKDVFTTEKANGFGMKFADEVGIGDFAPTNEGGTYKASFVQSGFESQINFVEWTNHMEITKTMMEDNLTSQIKKRAALFGKSYYRTQEKFRALMLANGKNNSFNMLQPDGVTQTAFGTRTADGVSLFNAAHPSKIDPTSTQSNRFTNALSKDVFGEIVSRMQGYVDDKGDIVDINPNTIIIGNDHATKQKVFEIIGSDKDPDTANNAFNYLFGTWRVICSPLLGQQLEPGEFIIADLNASADMGGAIWGDRLGLTTETDIAESTRNLLLFARSRYNAFFHNWRPFAIGGTGSGTTLT